MSLMFPLKLPTHKYVELIAENCRPGRHQTHEKARSSRDAQDAGTVSVSIGYLYSLTPSATSQ